MRKPTLIIVRRTLTEPNAALAGVMLEISFARSMASMAAFNDERTPSSRRCDRRESASMVETRGRQENDAFQRAVREDTSPNMDGRSFCHERPRAIGAIW